MRLSSSARLLVVVSLISVGQFACKPSEPTPDGGSCSTAADCSGDVTACTEHACVSGACRVQPKAAGTRVEAQTPGDCRVAVCNGNGGLASSVDDTDVPVDGNECTRDVCTVGTPSNPPAAADTACGMNGQLACNGQGQCVACQSADDCSMGTECQVRTCTAGVCGFDNVAVGTRVGTQTTGDCQVTQCDGQGAVQTIADNADLPVDGAECTQDLCTAGVPSNPPVTVGTTCTENDGSRCDAAGACVQCVMATDCPGIDTECQRRTCTAGVCGRAFTMDGTVVASQTANDCRQNVCDGQGRVVNRADNADLPNDNNACTADTCSAGAPVFTNRTAGETCGTSLICNGSGACVGCNTAADCPGTDTACSQRTCVDSVCGVNNVAVNTLTPNQVSNDCRREVCDGMGNAVNQNDDADLPADDGRECTSQVCSNGMPSFPTRPLNTACTQNGGAFCDNAGTCVQCNAPTQCPGADGECSTRSCVMGSCGVSFVPAGTPTDAGTQVTGDCRQRQCAGDGGVMFANLDTDVPADDGSQCTNQACSNGVAVFPPRPIDSACAQNGGTRCNATGACVQCNSASQCAGEDNECQARTCNASGACGFAYVAAGTPLSMQVTGDCREAQCAGDGGIVQANVDTDLPADDLNQCTSQTCSNGTAVTAPVPTRTACTQNNGTICSGTSCVQCIVAADCGQNTECRTYACNSGVCSESFTAPGFVVSQQTAGDCQQNQCDGAGNVVSVNTNDVPAPDTNQCTDAACVNGVPQQVAVAPGTACTQNGGTFCQGTSCVSCSTGQDCPGTDSECSVRTCNAGVCGRNILEEAGHVVAQQTPGNCQQNQCDASGNVVSVAFDVDVPVDDGTQCTVEQCNAGVASRPFAPADTACGSTGVCTATGDCVQCNVAAQCGTSNVCVTRTCTAQNTCSATFATVGTPAGTNTTGDCKVSQCDGAGVIEVVNSSTDVFNDGNPCTDDTCSNGTPVNTDSAQGTSCNGTNVCDGDGACVQCNVPSDCPNGNECQVRACSSNTCGFTNVSAGTATQTQQAGDCKQAECDGNGAVVQVNLDSDLPVDSSDCTANICTAGTPSTPSLAAGTACSTSGGNTCNGAGGCVVAPTVVSVAPPYTDGGVVTVASSVVVTFSRAMLTSSVTVQSVGGACSGSLQISQDGFASCIALGTPTWNGANTIATVSAAPGFAFGGTYKVKVTTAVREASGAPMQNEFEQGTGFTTPTDTTTLPSGVVISQVYGGGGGTASDIVYRADFVELHNRGLTSANISGWTIRYASTAGSTWNTVTIPASTILNPGQFFLARVSSDGSVGAALPTPDLLSSSISASATAAKFVLVSDAVAFPSGTTCPSGATIIDYVGYDPGTNCSEGTPAPRLSNATAAIRKFDGCTDTNNNAADFSVGTPTPRNRNSPAVICGIVVNETGVSEADYCVVQHPSSISVLTDGGIPTIYARIYEAGVTEGGGGASNVVAQIGYGPVTANPQWQSGWTWTNASFNSQFGNDDEYQLNLSMLDAGTYLYGARFSFDGQSWTYCDLNGAGSNPDLSFETSQLPRMTITP